MEQELETNDIKEQLKRLKEKLFNLKDKCQEYKDNIKSLSELPTVWECILIFYPLGILIGNFILIEPLVALLYKLSNSTVSTVIGLIVGFSMLAYALSETITRKTMKKFTQWYLKKNRS